MTGLEAEQNRPGAAPLVAATVAFRVRGLSARTRWIAAALATTFGINVLFSRYLFWDSYLDLAGGRYVVRHGIPHHEVWTTAARGDWIDQQWLAHAAYYAAWTGGGYPGVAFLSSLLVSSAFGGLAWAMTSRGVAPSRAFMWTLLAFAGCMGNTVIRAQSFAYALFVVLGWLLVTTRRRSFGRLTAIPVLLSVWGNLHGTVLLGVALSLAWSAWRLVESVRLRDRVGSFAYATVGLASAGAIFANPYGISIVHYYAALIGNGTVSHYIVEWASPSLGNPLSAVYFAIGALAVGVTSYAYGKGARPQMSLVAGAALLGVLSATGVRYQAWFVLAAVFLAASALAAVESPAPLAPRIEGLVSAFAVVFALVTLVVLVRTSDRTFERLSPRGELAATAAYVARHPQARVLADENASSALLWMFPATQGNVGFDARLEQYPVPALRRWLSFLSIDSPEWLRVLRSYDVVVVTRADRPELARRLLQLRGWRTLAASDDGIVRVRAAR